MQALGAEQPAGTEKVGLVSGDMHRLEEVARRNRQERNGFNGEPGSSRDRHGVDVASTGDPTGESNVWFERSDPWRKMP